MTIKKKMVLGMLTLGIVLGFYGLAQAGVLKSYIPSFAEYRDHAEQQMKQLEKMTREERNQLMEEQKALGREEMLLKNRFLGEGLRNALNQERVVVATVNNEPVFLSDIVRVKLDLDLLSMGSIPFEVTEDLVMERVVLEKAVYVEAKKRGLLPSQEEIAEKVNYYRRSTNESQDPDYAGPAAEDNKNYWNAYLDGLEMSDDEYWNTIAPDFYERWLIGCNLAIDVAEEVYGGIRSGGDKFWEYWENVYQKQLVAKADVKVTRPDLIASAMQPVSSDTSNALREMTEMARKYWESQEN